MHIPYLIPFFSFGCSAFDPANDRDFLEAEFIVSQGMLCGLDDYTSVAEGSFIIMHETFESSTCVMRVLADKPVDLSKLIYVRIDAVGNESRMPFGSGVICSSGEASWIPVWRADALFQPETQKASPEEHIRCLFLI